MEVANHEQVSRFLLFKRWFSRESKRVKAEAFIPHPYIELSVSCTESLSVDAIWSLGQAVVEQRSDSVRLYGRGDLKAATVRAQKLEITRDDNPKYHANITDWPNEGKAVQRMIAIELAAESKLVMHEF
jgi:hypothetical protein